jgi:hypothetical protein
MDNVDKLEAELMEQLLDSNGMSRYHSHDSLNAVLRVAATTIWNCSDTEEQIPRILEQFVTELQRQIMQRLSN